MQEVHSTMAKAFPILHLKQPSTTKTTLNLEAKHTKQYNGCDHQHTPLRVTGVPHKHPSFYRRRSFQLNSFFNYNLHGEFQNNYIHNPYIALNSQKTPHLEQVRSVVNDVNLLLTIMADQAIIQAAISLVETFDGNKTNLVMTSCE